MDVISSLQSFLAGFVWMGRILFAWLSDSLYDLLTYHIVLGNDLLGALIRLVVDIIDAVTGLGDFLRSTSIIDILTFGLPAILVLLIVTRVISLFR